MKKAPLVTIVAVLVGFIVLAGYFFPVLQPIQTILLGWAVILVGIATLVGIVNLLVVHWHKLSARNSRDFYSPFLILAFLVSFGVGLIFQPDRIVTSIQAPVETSLLAVLAISLAYASLRLLQRRHDIMTIIFVLSTVIFLLISSGMLGMSQNIPILKTLLAALNELPVAGARGILLGIALGSLTTGLRLLLGVDRPYSG